MFASDSMIGIELEPKLWQAFDEDTHQLLEKANRHFAIIHVPEQALVHTKFDKLGPQVANAYWKRWEDLFKAHLTLPLNAITVQEPDTEGLEPKERVVVEELLESDGDSGLRCTIRYRDEHLTALFSDIEPEDGNKRLKDLFAYYHEHA